MDLSLGARAQGAGRVAPSIGGSIDHVALLVADLDAGRAALEALGLAVSPQGRHVAFKTTNHVAVLERTYLELLAIEEPGVENTRHRELLAGGGGLGALAVPSADLWASVVSARAVGVEMGPIEAFDRPVEVGGEMRAAKFETAFLPPIKGLRAMVFVCHHHTPELVWDPDQARRPNGVSELVRVRLSTPRPEQAAAAVGAVLDVKPVQIGKAFVLRRGGQVLAFDPVSPSSLTLRVSQRPSPAALRIAGYSLERQSGNWLSIRHPALGSCQIELETDAGHAMHAPAAP